MQKCFGNINNWNKSNKGITFPILIIILADIVVAGLEFGKYYAENAPTSLIIAKVCAAIIKYPSYIGLCLFACNNINSFLFRNAGTMLRAILQRREMTHKWLASQAILAGIGHIISHGFYNPKEFSMPIGISGAFLMATMSALPISYMILHRSFPQISEGFAKFKQNISHVMFDKTHKMLAIASLVLYLLHIGLPNVDQEWWGVSDNVGDFMKAVSWGMALLVIGDKFYSWLKSDIKQVELTKLKSGQKETIIVKIPCKTTFNHVPGALLYIGFSSGDVLKDFPRSLHPFTISRIKEGHLYLTVRPSGRFTNALAKLELSNAQLRIFGPYNGPLSSIQKVNKAAVIVAGVGISFANSYLQYLINNTKKIPLYLIIKQESSNIDLLEKTGTLELIAQLVDQYEKNVDINATCKIILAISRIRINNENYNIMKKGLMEKINSLNKEININENIENIENIENNKVHIKFHNCSSEKTEREKFDAAIIEDIFNSSIKDIYYCGMSSWLPSLEKQACKKGLALISEVSGGISQATSQSNQRQLEINNSLNNSNLVTTGLINQSELEIQSHIQASSSSIIEETSNNSPRNIEKNDIELGVLEKSSIHDNCNNLSNIPLFLLFPIKINTDSLASQANKEQAKTQTGKEASSSSNAVNYYPG